MSPLLSMLLTKCMRVETRASEWMDVAHCAMHNSRSWLDVVCLTKHGMYDASPALHAVMVPGKQQPCGCCSRPLFCHMTCIKCHTQYGTAYSNCLCFCLSQTGCSNCPCFAFIIVLCLACYAGEQLRS
jgi:hypothetical protein